MPCGLMRATPSATPVRLLSLTLLGTWLARDRVFLVPFAASIPPRRLLATLVASTSRTLNTFRTLHSSARVCSETDDGQFSPGVPSGLSNPSNPSNPSTPGSHPGWNSDAEIAEIARLGTLLKTHKVANRILILARVVLLKGETHFSAFSPAAQVAVIMAHSILGNGIEAVSLFEALAESVEDPLRISDDPDFHSCILKSLVQMNYTAAALKALARLPASPSPDLISLVVCRLVVTGDLMGAIRLARRHIERHGVVHSRRSGAYLVAGIEGYAGRGDYAERMQDLNEVRGWFAENGRPDASAPIADCRAEHADSSDLEYLQYYVVAKCELFSNRQYRAAIGDASDEATLGLKPRIQPLLDRMVLLWRKRDCNKKDGERVTVAFASLMKGILEEGSRDVSIGAAETVSRMRALMDDMRAVGLRPSLYCYTTLLTAYYTYGGLEKLVQCYREMLKDEIEPDQAIFNILIRAYTLENLIDNAMELYEEMVVRRGLYANVRVLSSVMVAVGMRGDIESCVRLFGEIEQSGIKADHALYHVVMNAYAQESDVANVLAWYNRLLSANLTPTVVTYTIVMSAISRTADPEATRRWYDRMFSSTVLPNVHAYSLLIQDRAKRGDLAAAAHVYGDLVRARIRPSAATFTTLINAHITQGAGGGITPGLEEALELCSEMLQGAARPDVAVYHVIMKLFGSLGMHGRAVEVYERMRGEGGGEVVEPDETVYMSAIGAYAAMEDLEKLEGTLKEMLRRADVLGVRRYPPVVVLQTVLYKLSQMLWKRDAELVDKVAAMFERLFMEFLAVEATGSRPVLPTPELFEKLIRSTARNDSVRLAVLMYREMSGRGMAGQLEPITRDLIFKRLVAISGSQFGLLVDAMGASIVAGTGSADCVYLDEVLEMQKQQGTIQSILDAERLLLRLDESIRHCRPGTMTRAPEGSRGGSSTSSIGGIQIIPLNSTPQQPGLRSSTVLYLLDCFNGSALDLEALPRVWNLLVRHPARVEVTKGVILKYAETLTRYGQLDAVVGLMTVQCKAFGWREGMENLVEAVVGVMRRSGPSSIVHEAVIDAFWRK